jgi:hypothetical protein
MQEFCGFPLGTGVSAQPFNYENFPYAYRNFVLRPTKSCHYLFGQHNFKTLFSHSFSLG